jgi:hypothetical protein
VGVDRRTGHPDRAVPLYQWAFDPARETTTVPAMRTRTSVATTHLRVLRPLATGDVRLRWAARYRPGLSACVNPAPDGRKLAV